MRFSNAARTPAASQPSSAVDHPTRRAAMGPALAAGLAILARAWMPAQSPPYSDPTLRKIPQQNAKAARAAAAFLLPAAALALPLAARTRRGQAAAIAE